MLFNLCLAIITITAHASPHYITVWIHFAGALFSQKHSTPRPSSETGSWQDGGGTENNVENFVAGDLRLWEESASGSLWVLVKPFWTLHSSDHQTRKNKGYGKYGKRQIVNSYCCLIVSGVSISAALRYARGDEQQRLLAVWRFKNRWRGVE